MSERQVEKFKEKIFALQKEAIENEKILKELAGLEKYISETYISRVFYEIIQNADDCKSSKFKAFLLDNDLYLLNDGYEFTVDDLESLSRSAYSNKSRGTTIGYRGIGFKSVAGICQSVSLMSGNLEVCFSREKTEDLFGYPIDVPLLRVPHEGVLNSDQRNKAKSLMMEGKFNTCFILHNINLEKIYNDMVGVKTESLIFLRNIINTSIHINEKTTDISVKNKINYGDISDKIYATDQLIHYQHGTEKYGKLNNERQIRIWSYKNIQVSTDIEDSKTVRLSKNDAYAHAFLPMRTVTGLGARVNGDFSTDPSRTRIDPDDKTRESLSDLADLIVLLLKKLVDESINENEFSLLEVLIPYNNFQFFSIEPSYISEQIKKRIYESNINMESFCLKPKWLQNSDYELLSSELNKKSILFENVADKDYQNFFKKLGAFDMNLEEIFKLLSIKKISQEGLFAMLDYLFDELDTFKKFRKIPADILNNAKVFISEDGSILSAREFEPGILLDPSYISKIFNLTGRSMDAIEFCRLCDIPPDLIPVHLLAPFVQRLVLSSDSYHQAILTCWKLENQLSIPKKAIGKNVSYKSGLKIKNIGLFESNEVTPKWRDVEKVGALIMEQLKYKVVDVSKKNLGYDLEVIDQEGETKFIEVKKINKAGDDFLITDNEMFTARQKGISYYLLLIVQSGEALPSHYSLINYPLPMLNEKVERRAVKHENFCSGYKANYLKLNFSSPEDS